jgi:hypothetical protein
VDSWAGYFDFDLHFSLALISTLSVIYISLSSSITVLIVLLILRPIISSVTFRAEHFASNPSALAPSPSGLRNLACPGCALLHRTRKNYASSTSRVNRVCRYLDCRLISMKSLKCRVLINACATSSGRASQSWLIRR